MCVVILSGAKDPANERLPVFGPERDPITLCEVPRFAWNDAQEMNEARSFASNLFQPVK